MASDKAYVKHLDGRSEWNVEKLRELGFKKGSIIRVHMKNFLTYDYSMVFPGPRLNVILGPNGTGKSTITHAICLACAGSAATVGRSPDLKQFVKHNKEGEECFVEVDIFEKPDSGKVLRIKRSLNTETTGSKWMVDDKKSSEQQVKSLMRDLKIDVDNLCSFMPQDKVGNFSLQTPQGILQKTLEAITSIESPDKNLFEIQKELADVEGTKNRICADVEAKEKQLTTTLNRLREMETDVKRMQERGENQKLLEYINVKHCVTSSTEQSFKANEAQAVVDKADADLAAKEASTAPLEIFSREVKIRMSMREKACESIHTKLLKTNTEIQNARKEMDDMELQFDDVSNKLETIASGRKVLEKSRADFTRDIAAAEGQLEDLKKKLPKVDEQLKELNAQLAIKGAAVNELEESMEELKSGDLRRIEGQVSQIENSLKNVKDPRAIFKKNLLQVDPKHDKDAKFMDLVAREIENGAFEKEVFGPVGAYLMFKDPVVAAMVEKAIPRTKLTGYVAQTINDEAKLRNMNKDINIYTMLNVTAAARPYSKQMLDGLRDIGLKGYLTDEIECPEVVRAFLHDICNLNHHIWARTDSHAKVTKQHFERLCPIEDSSQISMFVHATGGGRGGGIEYHTGQRSKYVRTNLSLKTETPPPMPRILSAGGASSDAAGGRGELEERLAAFNKERSSLNAKIKKLQEEFVKIRDERSVMTTTRKLLLDTKKSPEVHESKLKTIKSKLAEVEKKLARDPVQETADLKRRQKECLSIRFQCAESVANTVNDRTNLEISLSVEEDALRTLSERLSEAEDALQDAKFSLTELKDSRKQAQRAREDAQKKLADCTTRLNTVVAKVGGQEKFRKYYVEEVMVKVPEDSIDAIEGREATVQAQLANVQEDPEVIQRHKKLLEDKEKQQKDVDSKRAEYENMQEDVKARSKSWEDQVDGVTEKLHCQFQKYMSDLSYDGAVNLVKKSTFDKHEMQMKVKFRENDLLTELSGQRHSGGERAVSTIMYLMALQEMTHAPFRAVDEINQGMDERNERLVFDRIVQSCCHERNKPQYFLVSPKLLQG